MRQRLLLFQKAIPAGSMYSLALIYYILPYLAVCLQEEDQHSAFSYGKIQVKCSCGAENCPEWAIVELQGVVEVQPSFQDRLQNLVIGELCRPSQENYTFTVGYHELTGSKVTLKKPLLVLKKVKYMDMDQSSENDLAKVELDVIGIIRHKILFKNRPKALISKPQPMVKERANAASN